MAGMGPPPKPANKRRNTRVPASWGGATPIEAPAAGSKDRVLGIDSPHQLVADMWKVLQTSAEAAFYSEADWARVAMELWHMNHVLTSGKPITANAWNVIQHGLTELLISPAAKRRAAIQLKPPDVDADEVAAVSIMSGYRDKLKPVSD